MRSLVAVLITMVAQAAALEGEVDRCFGRHPDAEITSQPASQPGLGVVLGARVLAEFGDDKDRYTDSKARRNYAGTSPITKTSGKQRVVLARYARNKRLADALHQQAFAALTASRGARAFYDHHRARGATHHQALRALSTHASSGFSTAAYATERPTTKPPRGHTANQQPLDDLRPWDI